MINIATDNDHGPHLGNRASKSGQPYRHQRIAPVPEQSLNGLPPRQAEGSELLGIFEMQIFKHLPRQRCNDGCDQQGLRNDHGRGGIQQAEEPERPGARQIQVDDQANHHRRQTHQSVDRHDHAAPPPKFSDGQQCAKRQAQT